LMGHKKTPPLYLNIAEAKSFRANSSTESLEL
jgi:hypothetical protein